MFNNSPCVKRAGGPILGDFGRVIESYNDKVHSAIKMCPNEAPWRKTDKWG